MDMFHKAFMFAFMIWLESEKDVEKFCQDIKRTKSDFIQTNNREDVIENFKKIVCEEYPNLATEEYLKFSMDCGEEDDKFGVGYIVDGSYESLIELSKLPQEFWSLQKYFDDLPTLHLVSSECRYKTYNKLETNFQ